MRKVGVVGSASLVLIGVALLLVPACSAPATEDLGTSREAATTPFANDKAAYDYFVAKGLTNFQAAGVVGNLDQESGVNPSISQSGGGVGRGIAQWSTGGRWDTSKNDNVLAFATMEGKSSTSLGLQLDFIWYELQTFSDYGLAKLQAATNVSDASIAFEDDYEGCVNADFPECDEAQRITYSKAVLAAYGSDPVQGGAGASAGGNAGAAGASSGGSSAAGGTTSAGGSAGASAAGSTSVAGGIGASGSADGSAGAPSSAAGAPSVTAGSSSSAAGSAAVPILAPSMTDSGCSFTRAAAPAPFGGGLAISVLMSVALALRLGRRRFKSAASETASVPSAPQSL